MEKNPKIGFALSGAGVRSLFYIGLLEELTKAGVPINYISACSSSSIIASAFACGKMQELKEWLLELDLSTLYSDVLVSAQSGGLYSLDKMEEELRKYTDGKRFEDVVPQLNFMAVDIESGQLVSLGLGDIAHASRISCTVPGLCQPVQWGNKLLVDGGLLSVLPVEAARDAGCDFICGVHIRGTKRIFNSKQIMARKVLKLLKQTLLIGQAKNLWHKLSNFITESDWWAFPTDQENEDLIGVSATTLSVLGRSMDIAIKAEKFEEQYREPDPDYLITLDTKNFGVWELGKSSELYELGREAGILHAPRLLQLIQNLK
jgi:predicted acylesterase/phospholipase RssA